MHALCALAVTTCLAISGCGVTVPADPTGTLDRVSGGVLRVGVTPNDDRVVIHDDGPPEGSDVVLVEDFADSIDADIEWVTGAEEELVRDLESGRLDLIAGGITDATPWSDKAGVTRPYLEVTQPDGTTLKLVMLTPMGENAFLSELETFLTEHDGKGE